mmetsp:Transcript_27027/g.64558  ORF Transcript_27027/g.64558 Transcript_27027/m.64558 type:complete len:99 (-) Transcript_27027:2187-2483(-)
MVDEIHKESYPLAMILYDSFMLVSSKLILGRAGLSKSASPSSSGLHRPSVGQHLLIGQGRGHGPMMLRASSFRLMTISVCLVHGRNRHRLRRQFHLIQ